MLGFLAGVPGKLATISTHLTSYLSSTRAAKIDNCDTTVSSRAPSSTALSNATWTDAKAGFVDMAISGVARIKSIQHVYASLSTGTDYTVGGNIAIAAVTTSKALVIFNGMSGNSNTWQTTSLRLTGSTTLAFAGMRAENTSNTFNVAAVVVEFY